MASKNRADALIRQQIELHGPMTFAEFMEIALYHPQFGYYHRSKPQRGRGGDYYTSLQVSKLFPEVFTDAILAMKETLGTDMFSLVEVGSGSGEFLHGVLTELTKRNQLRGFQVWSVEKSQSAREILRPMLTRFPKTRVISSMDEIDWMGSLEGVLFSNEFFDALSFHRLKFNGTAWEEIFISLDGETLAETTGPLSKNVAPLVSILNEFVAEPGQEVELRTQVKSVYDTWREWFLRGYLLTVDYGQPRSLLIDPSRPQGTWRCYYQHKLSTKALEHIGDQDITAHVDFTQLVEEGKKNEFEALHFSSQGLFLTHVGQTRIEKYLTSGTEEEKKTTAAVVQQLLHPSAMGEKFWVLLQGKDAPLPPAFQCIPNRISRLMPKNAAK